MSEDFKVGDRVTIGSVFRPVDRRHSGRTGVVKRVIHQTSHLPTRYVVEVDGAAGARVLTENPGHVDPSFNVGDLVRVGDRVVIRAVGFPRDERFVGVQGKVEHAFAGGRKFAVRTDGNVLVIATAVEMAYTAENHSWRDEEAAVEKLHRYGIIDDETLRHELQRINDECSRPTPDKKRTQAVEFARRILGTDADLDDLLRLAEWALNEQTERVTFNPGGVIFTPNDAETTRRLAEGLAKSGRIVAEPQEPPRPPADLRIKDTDGDAVNFRGISGRPDTVAFIVGAPAGTYVTAEDADRIIAFLQGMKAARNT